jgi:hypothetical protein
MSKSLVGPVVSGGGDPFWSERLERDPLLKDGTGAGRRDSEAGSGTTGGRCVWTVTRVRRSTRPRISRSKSSGRHRPRDTAGKLQRGVTLLSPFIATRSRTKQGRARHREGSPGRETPRAFNTATPDLDQHPPPFRMGAEMARGSESAFLICTPKPRLCRGLHPNGTIAPMDLDRSTNGSNFEHPTAIQI